MTYLCNWCGTVGVEENSWVTEYRDGKIIWQGCASCYRKKEEAKKNDAR